MWRTRALSLSAALVLATIPSLASAQVDEAQGFEGADALGDPAPGATPVTRPPEEAAAGEDAVAGEADQVPPPPGEAAPPSSYGSGAPSGDARYPSAALAGAADEGVRIPSRIATRLRVLDADFNALSSRGSNALVDGILSILTGGLSITLGYFIDHEFLTPYLYVYGAAGIARGIIDLTLMPDPHGPYIEFSHMPMGTMAQVNERLDYGERELESLADRTRLARILDASINILVGVSIVPLYLGPNEFEVDTFGTFVIIGASISVISGVINLLSRSEAERRWSAYEELSERLEREEQSAALRLRWGAMPLPGGAGFSLGASF